MIPHEPMGRYRRAVDGGGPLPPDAADGPLWIWASRTAGVGVVVAAIGGALLAIMVWGYNDPGGSRTAGAVFLVAPVFAGCLLTFVFARWLTAYPKGARRSFLCFAILCLLLSALLALSPGAVVASAGAINNASADGRVTALFLALAGVLLLVARRLAGRAWARSRAPSRDADAAGTPGPGL
jgi:hypothetical protein